MSEDIIKTVKTQLAKLEEHWQNEYGTDLDNAAVLEATKKLIQEAQQEFILGRLKHFRGLYLVVLKSLVESSIKEETGPPHQDVIYISKKEDGPKDDKKPEGKGKENLRPSNNGVRATRLS